MTRSAVRLEFALPYRMTAEGGFIEVLLYPHGLPSSSDEPLAIRLDNRPGSDLWEGEAELSRSLARGLRYQYRACDASGAVLHSEPGICHRLPFKSFPEERIRLEDLWVEPSEERVLAHPALKPFLPKKPKSYFTKKLPPLTSGSTVFYLDKPLPYPGELVLTGDHPLLGRWDPAKGLDIDPHEGGGYYFRLPEEVRDGGYKFALITPDGDTVWEEGENRYLEPEEGQKAFLTTLRKPVFPGFSQADSLALPSLQGTAVPLFSLRTERSFGVGDFSDAKAFADWQSEIGQHVLQFLPLYDTRFRDSEKDTYPYNATTTFGLHPLFLDVRKLPFYDDAPALTRKQWERKADRLNRLEKVSYLEALALKLDIARYSFRRYIRASVEKLSEELRTLFGELYETVYPELRGYAFFYSMHKRFPGKGLQDWPEYAPDAFEEDEEYYFSLFLQLQLYTQLSELSAYAREKGVLLKGDLPIGVGRDSVDVWMHPGFFHTDRSAGSPPDAFSETGQNWGFPTYDWEAMKRDGYRWWHKRLGVMGRYFSLIRVDHILGFFRIYSIPLHAKSNLSGYYVPGKGYREDEVSDILPFFSKDTEGLYHPHLSPENESYYDRLPDKERERVLYYRDEYYYRRNEELWRKTALERLSGVFADCPMVVCAEDLGVLPKSITEVLRSFQILSLEVIRMSKKPGKPFVFPDDIPYLSVLATSTHDTSTIREWWLDELTEEERKVLAEAYGSKVSTGSLMRALRRVGNLFLILPLQDWFTLAHYNSAIPAYKERINLPSDPYNVWDYRMAGYIKDLPTGF